MNAISLRAARRVAIPLLACLAAFSSQAAIVQAAIAPMGGTAWSASFVVVGSGAQVIESFTVYLDAAFTRNLVVQASPADWDTLAIQADPALSSDAMVDALHLGPGGIGATAQAGFEVAFDWLGAAAPTAMRYSINDPTTFAVLESGTTVPMATNAVPEPVSAALVAGALVLARLGRARQPSR